ncbi:MAG: BON domain-containing protein [Acidovorax sp.]|uniref:BON domain-containing protein n=1 Tax=Acidovorax sp. TaxID=1872122 RepID=UPI0022C4CF06|nr:BON domain-containing protein [Acidovorax sp.]MCZ8222050.1 BON domain-containing protein [Acidovorax sp.]
MRYLTIHHTLQPIPGSVFVLLTLLVLLPLLGCKRSDMTTLWAPASPLPVAYLEDSVITSRVRAALIVSPVVNSYNISVESHDGVVLLSGMAEDPTQIDLAVFVAQTVPGVKSVDSFMFSNSTAPALVVRQSHIPDLQALRSQRLLTSVPSQQYRGRQAQTGADEPPKPSSAVYGEATPPPPPSPTPEFPNAMQPQDSPCPSRWVTIAYSVLGIRSIQDDLKIKP